MVHLVSEHLFERAIPVPAWPERRDVEIIGIRDPAFFESLFASKVTYTNTRFDPASGVDAPFVDLTDPADAFRARADVAICCDVLEHVAPPVQRAFDGLFEILRPGGLLVLTVPYTFDRTVEHFPDLAHWSLEARENDVVLVNTTRDGRQEIFRDLHFRTLGVKALEMRLFGLADLKRHLRDAGFVDVRVFDEDHLEYGIGFPVRWSLPITARRPD